MVFDVCGKCTALMYPENDILVCEMCGNKARHKDLEVDQIIDRILWLMDYSGYTPNDIKKIMDTAVNKHIQKYNNQGHLPGDNYVK